MSSDALAFEESKTSYRHTELNDVTRGKVLESIAECARVGMHTFLELHGYRPSAKFQLRWKGKSYPSKAILGVAAGLTSQEFFGGAAVVVRHLTRLGFQIREGRRIVTAVGLLDLARQARAQGDKREIYELPELPLEPSSYFASGSNRCAEIRGMASVGQDVGVAAQELREPALAELSALAGSDIQVFVDSGAFEEFTRKKPITHEEWVRRLGLYARIAKVLGDQAWLVAPDKIGDQNTTLARLERYKPFLAEIAKTGARILAPIQKGDRTQAAFALEVERVLEGIAWIPALPCKAKATDAKGCGEFLDARPQTKHVHLLGLGPMNRDAARFLAHAKRIGCSVSLDSNWITGHSGSGEAPSQMKHKAAQRTLFVSPTKARLYTWAQGVAKKMLEGVKTLEAKGRELALIISFGFASVLATDDVDTE